MKYAVLEWEHNIDNEACFICKDVKKEFAESMVKIAPLHLHREIWTMDALEERK